MLAAFFKKQWSVLWRFLVCIAAIYFLLRKVEIPQLKCRLGVPSSTNISIVDISEQRKEVEKLAPKTLFFGPSDEKIPEDLRLPEWDKMEYMEPVFVFP
ncbi:MAG: hypothetical protein LBS71_00110 [Puniceicoccales bacterium]|jgi:hypothetical protein|nr:hypothetical protein [Puniceicoccales bacterium]